MLEDCRLQSYSVRAYCQNTMKIIKIVATKCHFLKLKCTNSISAGAPPQTPLGKLTALPRPLSLAKFKKPTFKGKGRKDGRDGQGRKRMGGNGLLLRRRGNEGKGTGGLALKRKNQTSPMTLSMDGKSLSNGKGV